MLKDIRKCLPVQFSEPVPVLGPLNQRYERGGSETWKVTFCGSV